jgi:hypothetical protein
MRWVYPQSNATSVGSQQNNATRLKLYVRMPGGLGGSMTRKHNLHGLRIRTINNEVGEIWLGAPGDPESDCLAQFHLDFLESIRDVLNDIHKSPNINEPLIMRGVHKYGK